MVLVSLCLSDECDPQSILLRGHGKKYVYKDNSYTLSLIYFQERNGSTFVSLLNKHFIGIINHMMAEAAMSEAVFMLTRSK